MDVLLAVLCGTLVCGGMVVLGAGWRGVPGSTDASAGWRRALGRARDGARARLRLRRAGQFTAAVAGGLVAALLTGWAVLLLVVPAAVFGLPLLLSAPANRDLELLEALDRWVRTLGSLLPTGRSICDAIRTSVRQAPKLLASDLRTLAARLDDRWTIEQALFALADELDSPDADAVLAALALAAQRGGTGATATLAALADNIQDRLRALRDIETERAKPRIVVRQVTGLTVAVLLAAMVFSGGFFTPYASGPGQLILGALVAVYLGSLLFLRRMTLPRARQRILRRAA